MSNQILCARLAAGVAALTAMTAHASGHGFAGSRFFPATLATDDPFVADELSLPTVSGIVAPGDDGPEVNDTEFSVDIAKRITTNFGVEVGATYLNLKPKGGSTISGFDNVGLGAKYQLDVDPEHEMIWAIGVDADLGGTGAAQVGAEDFTTLTPSVFFGKGFDDMADKTSWARAFALTGSAGVSFPTRSQSDGASNPDVFNLGLALEYSIPYLQAQVKDAGLGAPFNRMIPVVELTLEAPFDGGGTTGTINPGVLWAGQYVQLGAEAVIPMNERTGRHVGFIAQLHFFLDDLFPDAFGRPLFGGGR